MASGDLANRRTCEATTFCWLPLIAARLIAPSQPHRRRLAGCAAAYRAGLASAPGSTAWKIGPSGDGADDDAVALDDSHDSQESCR